MNAAMLPMLLNNPEEAARMAAMRGTPPQLPITQPQVGIPGVPQGQPPVGFGSLGQAIQQPQAPQYQAPGAVNPGAPPGGGAVGPDIMTLIAQLMQGGRPPGVPGQGLGQAVLGR